MSKPTLCWVSDGIPNPGKETGYIEIISYPKVKNFYETILNAVPWEYAIPLTKQEIESLTNDYNS